MKEELLKYISENSKSDFSNIKQIALIKHVGDASGAIEEGCVLLAITENKDLDDGDPFFCLVGLPKSLVVGSWLSHFFPKSTQ